MKWRLGLDESDSLLIHLNRLFRGRDWKQEFGESNILIDYFIADVM